MSLLFAHDHKFRKIDNDYYSTGGLNNDVLSQYVNMFGSVTVIARVVEESEIKNKY